MLTNLSRQDVAQEKRVESKAARLEKIKREAGERKLYKEGRLIHRTEPEVKTHTSYLVFAVLPKQWSVDDEAEASALYSVDDTMRNSPASKEKETTS
jgi:tRNA (adenine57-N1/adenine58-N1)-methyltransferase